MARTRLLFLCSRNQWRSPTAEALFKNHPRYDARSAGTATSARIKVTGCHIDWADMIFCMEHKHASRLRENYSSELGDKPLITLRIPDDFQRDDPELIALLRERLAPHLEL